MISADVVMRFWPKVDRPGDGCWEWAAFRDRGGYGRLNIGRIPVLAHRISWEIANGPIPDGMFVCHRCDNPPCVRPDHLFLGTAKDNNDDKLDKGRGTPPPHSRGLKHHNVTIADEQVREARESFAAGREYQYEIAARLGVGRSSVREWVAGRGSTRGRRSHRRPQVPTQAEAGRAEERRMKRTLAWLAFTILPTTATTYLVLGWVRAW